MADSGRARTLASRPSSASSASGMFQQQLIVFVLVNVLLWVIWAATGAGFPWPIFVTVFWGIGIATQAWTIYRGAAPITEAEIQREMGKEPGTA